MASQKRDSRGRSTKGPSFTVHAELDTSDVRQGLSEVNDAMGLSVTEINQGAELIGKAFGAISGGVKLFLSAMIAVTSAAVDYGEAVAEVQTISDQAVFSTARINEITKGLADTYGSDITSNAKALYQTISAGTTDAAGATLLLDSAARFSIGGITDMTTAVDALTTVVNAYRGTGLTAAEASDALFVAIRDGKTTAEELGQNIGQVAGIARQAGVAFDEVAASVAAITTNGISTETAVIQLRQILASVIKPSKEAAREARRLGVEFSIAGLKANGLKGLLDEITGSSRFTDESMAKLFGNVRALAGAMALTANDGAKLAEILDDEAKKAGAADAAFERMSETLGHQIGRYQALRHELEVTLGTMTSESEPALRAIKGVNAALSELIEFFEGDRGKRAAGAFFSLLHKGLIVATDATRSLVRGMAAISGSDALKDVADELFEVHKALELARQGFDDSVHGKLLDEVAKRNVEAFQEILATQEALRTILKDASLEEKAMHVQRIAQLDLEIDERRGLFEERKGGLQELLEAEREFARKLNEGVEAAGDKPGDELAKKLGDKVGKKVKESLDDALSTAAHEVLNAGASDEAETRQRHERIIKLDQEMADRRGALRAELQEIERRDVELHERGLFDLQEQIRTQGFEGLLNISREQIDMLLDTMGVVDQQTKKLYGDLIEIAQSAAQIAYDGINRIMGGMVEAAVRGENALAAAGKIFGGMIKQMGYMLLQLGTAALLTQALSYIPLFTPIVGAPGQGAVAGAVAVAGGLALIAAGAAIEGGGNPGASGPGAGRSGGSRGGGRDGRSQAPRLATLDRNRSAGGASDGFVAAPSGGGNIYNSYTIHVGAGAILGTTEAGAGRALERLIKKGKRLDGAPAGA